jgi:chemotaxis protein MotB
MAKKTKPPDEKFHPPDWMTTWSDLVSLLMVFFVLMFALSTLDPAKFNQAAASMSVSARAVTILETFQGESLVVREMGNGIIQFPVPPTNLNPRDAEEPEHGEEPYPPDYEALRIADAGAELTIIEDDLRTYFPDSTGAAQGDPHQVPPAEEDDRIRIDRGDYVITITLPGSVSFHSGRHDLTDTAVDVLTFIAEVIKRYPDNQIEIHGYADSQPLTSTVRYRDNEELSTMRAREVRDFFVTQGVNREIMLVAGWGELFPIASNETEEGRALNRRVEIKIISTVYTGTPSRVNGR